MGLKCSQLTTRETPNAMKLDPTKKRGARLIKEEIARQTGIHLTRYEKCQRKQELARSLTHKNKLSFPVFPARIEYKSLTIERTCF
ncbi:hypothetical protein K439DRAFT_1632355 [Ramaria rubella]|nr:hypothetical protein K439DRAFT_1632355 [Ramaria rubella]